MKIVGLVAVKANSKRFPGKNLYKHKGFPLFFHSVKPLIESTLVDEVYVITNTAPAGAGYKIIWRPKNASRDEDKLINVLRFGYYRLDEEYDAVVTIMANCPGHTVNSVDSAIILLKDKKLKEVRSFNKAGEESGLMVFSKTLMEVNSDISYYMGGIVSDVKEIHYKEDLDE